MTAPGEMREEDHTDDLVAIIDAWVKRGAELDRRISDLEQDRSDLWRCLGIPQYASVDVAIAKVIEIRTPATDTPRETRDAPHDFDALTEALWAGAAALDYVAEYVEQDHAASVRKRAFAETLRAAYNIPDVADAVMRAAVPPGETTGE